MTDQSRGHQDAEGSIRISKEDAELADSLGSETIRGRDFAGTSYAADAREQTADSRDPDVVATNDRAQEGVAEDLADPDIPA